MVNDAIVDLRYFTADNFTGAPVRGYYAPHPILSIEAAKALKKAADVLRESGYLIVVYDTYRPIKAVQCFIEWVNDLDDPGNNRFFPGLTKKQILEHGYIDQYSTHSRGSAIDLGLCNRQGKRIDMGTEFDFFGERSHLDAAVTPEQARNRMILQNAMLNAGFLPQANEWWHFRLEQEPYPDIYWDFDIR
ncbi:MAG: peptidase M15 [Lentisphaeria bacterium]|nr:peptidase M15 [Lentisphaeria bacterium]